MDRTKIAAAMLAAGLIGLAGCEKKEPAPSADGAAKSITDAANKAIDSAKAKAAETVDAAKTAMVEQAQKGLDSAKAQFETLKGKAASIPENLKPEYEKAVASIDEQFKTVSTKLEGLKSAGADAWKKIESELAPAMTKLQDELKAAMAKFGA
jgi:type VI protein secretion system component VasK